MQDASTSSCLEVGHYSNASRRLQDSWRISLHTGLWPLKIILWGVLLGVTFAFPNHAIYIYGQVARVFSGFFLVLQVWPQKGDACLLLRKAYRSRQLGACSLVLCCADMGTALIAGPATHFKQDGLSMKLQFCCPGSDHDRLHLPDQHLAA